MIWLQKHDLFADSAKFSNYKLSEISELFIEFCGSELTTFLYDFMTEVFEIYYNQISKNSNLMREILGNYWQIFALWTAFKGH